MWYVAAFFLMIGLALIVGVPRDISSLIAIKEVKDAESDVLESTFHSNEPAIVQAKRKIWLQGCWFSFERSMMICGLEAGAAMIFETEFYFNTSDTGMVLAFAFVVGLPFCFILQAVKAKGVITTQTLTLALTSICFFAIIFLLKVFHSQWVFTFA